MRIVEVRVAGFERRLRRPLATAHGRLTQRAGIRLQLWDSDGHRGVGEASPLIAFGGESLPETQRSLERAARELRGRELDSPALRLAAIERAGKLGPGARWAIDCALHDLFARERGCSVADLLCERAPRESVELALLLDADDPQTLAHQGRSAAASGYATLKVKVGHSDGAADLERVAALREAVGENVRLRLDANEAWSRDEAERQLDQLARYSPELIEQPVARSDIAGLAALRRAGLVPIAADESALLADLLRRVLEAEAVDVVVLKPAALGGLERSLRIAAEVRSAGPQVIVTSLLDGAISIAGALAVAASLPDPPLACGLASAGWLEAEGVKAPAIRRGRIELAGLRGLGVEIQR